MSIFAIPLFSNFRQICDDFSRDSQFREKGKKTFSFQSQCIGGPKCDVVLGTKEQNPVVRFSLIRSRELP